MGYLKFSFALAFAAGLLMYPAPALSAAQRAMEMWYRSVAPALFPFAALMPYLTSVEARYIYDKILGWFMYRAFRLPGRCASAFVTGLFSGSPGGSMAAARVAAAERLSPGQAARLAGICCGMSPVYLVSSLGTVILGSPSTGWKLVIAQWISHIMVGIGFSGCWRDEKPGADVQYNEAGADSVAHAAMAVLKVCGYMVLFSVGRCVAEEMTGFDLRLAGIFLDLPGGAAYMRNNIWVFSPAVGFGGVCIAAQNMSVLKKAGVTWKRYLVQKAAAAVLCTGIYGAMDRMEEIRFSLPENRYFEVILLLLMLVMIPAAGAFFPRKRRGSTES